MKRFARRVVAITTVVTVLGFWTEESVAEKIDTNKSAPELPGLGDPGKLIAILVEEPSDFVLRGPEARRQLIVSGKYESGGVRDLTHEVTYGTSPAGILRIDSDGLVVPLADGQATILAKGPKGLVGKSRLTVEGFTADIPIDFDNQIVPIFTKKGCNAGGCHGKASGQNGFKLSLLGFYPDDDYEFLVKEAWGRRLFPSAPERSLLLRKPTNTMPHGGGKVIEIGSGQYRLLRRWISQGMPRSSKEHLRRVESIEIFPRTRLMDRNDKQQIRVMAHYSNGWAEDVTRMTQFEPNDTEMAAVSTAGLVTTLDLTGEVAIMARYQANVDVFRASIPLGIELGELPQPKSFIDELVFEKFSELGIPPSPICDDPTFLRRVTIDITGRIPTADAAKSFLANQDTAKRDELIDRLLDDPAYADYFANKWSTVLRNKRVSDAYTSGTYAFHEWIRDSLRWNLPYDQFVRQILAASGGIEQNPLVAWYRTVSTKSEQLEDTAQLFLGLRIQCARCHHHPFERWSQRDYYSFSAFFSRVGRKNSRNGLKTRDDVRIYHNRGVASATLQRTGERLLPTGLGSQPLQIDADEDPRHALVDWMVDPENPFFGRALVNRYWKHFFSRGLVDPEDDMRVTNPASNEELLEALSRYFIENGFDLKDLVRRICRSNTYQLSSEPNEYNITDKQNFTRYYSKRLNAEVLYDALNQVTDVPTRFPGVPVGTRAVQLPDSGVNNYFLDVFGRPKGESACECERVSEANLAQSLHLLNSQEIQGKLSSAGGRATRFAKDKERSHEEKVYELFLWAFARPANSEEIDIALSHIEKTKSDQQSYEDILWALINTKEFLFNH